MTGIPETPEDQMRQPTVMTTFTLAVVLIVYPCFTVLVTWACSSVQSLSKTAELIGGTLAGKHGFSLGSLRLNLVYASP